MIAIPIWLFVIYVTISVLFIGFIVITIVSYVTYCHYQDQKINERIKQNYEKKE